MRIGRWFSKTGSLAVLAVLAGCSTITTGTTQSIFINTPKMTGAKCTLSDSAGGRWTLLQTPGAVTVNKGDGPMTILCRADGYADGITTIDETLVGATFGNIILGGGIGFIVDAASGGAQEYPDSAVVWMRPKQFSSGTAETAWRREKVEYDISETVKQARDKCNNETDDCEAVARQAGLRACRTGRGVVDCAAHALLRE